MVEAIKQTTSSQVQIPDNLDESSRPSPAEQRSKESFLRGEALPPQSACAAAAQQRTPQRGRGWASRAKDDGAGGGVEVLGQVQLEGCLKDLNSQPAAPQK